MSEDHGLDQAETFSYAGGKDVAQCRHEPVYRLVNGSESAVDRLYPKGICCVCIVASILKSSAQLWKRVE